MRCLIPFLSTLSVVAVTLLIIGFPPTEAYAADEVLASGGALGTLLSPGLIDVEGDGIHLRCYK